MPTHRKPKGVYARDTWDWYQQHNAVVSFLDGTPFVGPNNSTYTLWSLTNDDPRGRSFWISLVLGNWDTGTMTILSFQNPQLLTQVAVGTSINPAWGAQPGRLGYNRFDHVSAFPDPVNPHIGTAYAVLSNTGFSGSPNIVRPVVILPANMTLMLGNDISIGTPWAMTIFYTVMPSGW